MLSSPDPNLSIITRGLHPTTGTAGFEPLLTGGFLPILLPTPPPPNPRESTARTVAADLQRVRPQLDTLAREAGLSLFDNQGDRFFFPATPDTRIPLGDRILSFEPETLRARITPNLPDIIHTALGFLENTPRTFTGSDLRVLLELSPGHVLGSSRVRLAKQLVECTTLTVSTHREKAAVRAAGYINPKAYARGKRTVAGTLILTQFTLDVLFRFLQAVLINDISKDTHFVKVDQLPPVDMTLLYGDEHGNVSFRRLLGVEFVTDGTVYSTQDQLSEQTISYVASDFTPLTPVFFHTLFDPPVLRRPSVWERTVEDVLRRTGLGSRQF